MYVIHYMVYTEWGVRGAWLWKNKRPSEHFRTLTFQHSVYQSTYNHSGISQGRVVDCGD